MLQLTSLQAAHYLWLYLAMVLAGERLAQLLGLFYLLPLSVFMIFTILPKQQIRTFIYYFLTGVICSVILIVISKDGMSSLVEHSVPFLYDRSLYILGYLGISLAGKSFYQLSIFIYFCPLAIFLFLSILTKISIQQSAALYARSAIILLICLAIRGYCSVLNVLIMLPLLISFSSVHIVNELAKRPWSDPDDIFDVYVIYSYLVGMAGVLFIIDTQPKPMLMRICGVSSLYIFYFIIKFWSPIITKVEQVLARVDIFNTKK